MNLYSRISENKQVIKGLFFIIWCFFILRLGFSFNLEYKYISNFNQLVIFLLSVCDVVVFFSFCIYLIISFLYKNKSAVAILIFYPLFAATGYLLNDTKNIYQDDILLKHFVTISSIFLFFSIIKMNKLFNYDFKKFLLKIMLIGILLLFLSNILPNIIMKITNNEDINVSSRIFFNSIFGFKNVTQNINGQTRIVFVLQLISLLLFRNFILKKKLISYFFFLISLSLAIIIVVSESRLNLIAYIISSVFILFAIKEISLIKKLFYFLLITILPFYFNYFYFNKEHRIIETYETDYSQELLSIDFKNKNLLPIINELKNNKHKKFELYELINKNNSYKQITLNEKIYKIEKRLEKSLNDSRKSIINKKKILHKNEIDNKLLSEEDAKLLLLIKWNKVSNAIESEKKDPKKIQNIYKEILQLSNTIDNLKIINCSMKVFECNKYNFMQRKTFLDGKIYSNLILDNHDFIESNKRILLILCSKSLQKLDNKLTGRVCGWEILLKSITTRSFFFGNGFFFDQVYLKGIEKISSNSWINIFFNAGIFSFLIYLFFLIVILTNLYKTIKINNCNLYLSISKYLVIYILARSVFEDTIVFANIDLYLLGICCLILMERKKMKLSKFVKI